MSQIFKSSSGGSGGGDVVGPDSATDGDIAVFDGSTGKIIRDSLVNISSDPTTFGSITSLQSSSAGLGLEFSNTGAGVNAGSYVNLVTMAGDAVYNWGNENISYQLGLGQDNNLHLNVNPINENALSGTTLLRVDAPTSATGRFSFTGGMAFSRKSVAVSSAILSTDYYIGVTNTGAPRTITLPAVATLVSGQVFIIKDETGGAATNNITIIPASAVNIDGASTYVINTEYGSIQIMYSGTQFYVF